MARLTVITGPLVEPVTLSEAKDHLRVDHNDEDTLIVALIAAARQEAENRTERALIERTLEFAVDGWACPIKLPMQPIQSVVSVKYDDLDGMEQTLDAANYRLTGWESTEWRPAYGVTLPGLRNHAEAVRIRYVAGYGPAASDVPMPIRHWMLIMIGTLYEYREGVASGQMPATVPTLDALIAPYVVPRF